MKKGRVLTAAAVKNESELGYHADASQPGLYLQVSRTQTGLSKSWIFRFTSPTTGKRREMGLGPVTINMGLAEARQAAIQQRHLVGQGIDPLDLRAQTKAAQRAASAVPTFAEAARTYIGMRASEWSSQKHAAQWLSTLTTHVFPVMGSVPVNKITTDLVQQVLTPIWTTKTETATRVRQRIEKVMDWARSHGYAEGDNPARLAGNLAERLPRSQKVKKVRHHPAVPFDRIHEFVTELRAEGGIGALALEFLLHTATRTSEVTNAQWQEIDLTQRVWTIPAERMKAGETHRVPLNDRAVAILKSLSHSEQEEFVFSGNGRRKGAGISIGTMLATMKRLPNFSQYVPHGLRSTFRDWASERTHYANETLELALAHAIKSRSEASYRRGDQLEKRRPLMNDWGRFIELNPTTQGSNVIPLRGAM